MKCGHVTADGDALGVSLCPCAFKTVLISYLCRHTVVLREANRLGADASFCINLTLPQMNQRLLKFCFL